MRNTRKKKKYRVIDCINVVWECEAYSSKEAKDKYWRLTTDVVEFHRLIDEGSFDTEVHEIDNKGDCV